MDTSKSRLSRRAFTATGLAAIGATAACSNGIGNTNDVKIDARVNATLNQMYDRYPGTRDLASKSAGMLVMPLLTEAGLGLGGGYGRGALRVGGATVDYYSATRASAVSSAAHQPSSPVLCARGMFRLNPSPAPAPVSWACPTKKG